VNGDTKDFEPIKREIYRQYDEISKAVDSLDTKIGIGLGFVFLVISQLVVNDIVRLPDEGNVPSETLLAVLGFAALLLSGLFGLAAFSIRGFGGGPTIPELVEQYLGGEDRNYDMAIARLVYDSHQVNKNHARNKAFWAKSMFIAFLIGMIVVAISSMV
jgi:hypothetical protein